MAEANSFIRPDELWHFLGLRAGQVVVHLGCGAGFYLIPAAEIVGPKGRAIGVDIRPDILAEAENRARRHNVDSIVETLRANIENNPGSSLPDKTADWVLIANILHQSNPRPVLEEARRIVAANGTIAIIGWSTAATPFGPPIDQRRSANEIIDLAQSLGLVFVKEFAPSPYHFGLEFTV